jgi:hypothetical protein
MSLPDALWQQVRERAAGACEYCGVTDTDSGGPLTVDHFQPRARGGTDDLSNLLYCCWRCNLYKADYWPADPGAVALGTPARSRLRRTASSSQTRVYTRSRPPGDSRSSACVSTVRRSSRIAGAVSTNPKLCDYSSSTVKR